MCNSPICKCISIVFSALFGLAVAVLFFFGLIPFILPAIIIALVLAALILFIVSLILISLLVCKPCFHLGELCSSLLFTMAVAFGTIIISIIALSIALVAGSIFGIVVIFFFALFLSLMIISFICLLTALINLICRKC